MNTLYLEQDIGEVSDGHHTFHELYTHRHLLFINLVRRLKNIAFKTRRDKKEDEIGEWFLLGLETTHGQITYHLPNEYWGYVTDIKELDYNEGYDGHTSEDVIERLRLLLQENYGEEITLGESVHDDVIEREITIFSHIDIHGQDTD